jgi:hypothetical protein
MKKMLIMLAVATIPSAAGCCGLGACPCNPCNWFNRGAYCGPVTPAYAPIVAAPCPTPCGPAVSTVVPQYPVQTAAPFAAAPMAAPAMMGAPMIADPSALSYAMPSQPMYYSEPGCGYVEPGCGYMGNVGYGPSMPMGCESGCCDGNYAGAIMSAPTETTVVDPTPVAE